MSTQLSDNAVDAILRCAKVTEIAENGPPPPDDKTPKREVDARYVMDLDDGVMVNSAALWPLLGPQWKDPKKWWKELATAQGKKDYDWSHLAARYFPTRARKKCEVDPSLAVAHRCFWELHPAKAYAWELRLQDEIRFDFTITGAAAEARSDGTQARLSPLCHDQPMKALLRAFSIIHGLMAALFACAAFMLIIIAAKGGWQAIAGGLDRRAAQQIIESVGLLAAAVVALQIAQTIAEEEVARDAHISGPTRIRRFLSRFLVVIVVALTIEGLVATFKAAHEAPAHMLYAASILLSAGALLVGWGVFIRMNRYAEELEPEAMADAKREDRKLK